MADRQYGIQPGSSLTGAPPPYIPNRRPVRSKTPAGNDNTIQQTFPQPYAMHDAQAEAPPPPVHRSIVSLNDHLEQAGPGYATTNTSEVSAYHPSDGGLKAIHDLDNLYTSRMRSPSPHIQPTIARRDVPRALPVAAAHELSPYQQPIPRPLSRQNPFSDQASPLMAHPAHRSSSPHTLAPPSPYGDNPRLSSPSMMHRHSSYQGDGYDDFDPNAIADDDDDHHVHDNAVRPRSKLGFAPVIVRPFASRDNSAQYGPVPNATAALPGGRLEPPLEKGDWLAEQKAASRRRKVILWLVGIIVLLAIVAGAVIGGVVASKKSNGSSASSTGSGSSGSHSAGLYDINSHEVQQLLNNGDLHKVFPAMDYTPLNAQYPDCLSNPPDQNNITLDVAVLSQLAPSVRLYGTDCGQTEMVLDAINRLQMNSSMTVWLGVWLGTNSTTNDRQLAQMYDILDTYPASHFAGVIVGNEVLYRKDMTLTQLGTILSGVRSNLTAKGISLPVATSDLGDNWTTGLAATSDIIMANVHPFFAGVTPDVAPGWTYNFWQQHDSNLVSTKSVAYPKSIISEVGWPSDGGNDCGTLTGSCPSGQGAVASIDNMNKFMDGFVCQSMTNGTTYFWFEAFDEPWKVIFNTADDQWESKWGLMDSDRNLKSGIKIPDCGGKTISKVY